MFQHNLANTQLTNNTKTQIQTHTQPTTTFTNMFKTCFKHNNSKSNQNGLAKTNTNTNFRTTTQHNKSKQNAKRLCTRKGQIHVSNQTTCSNTFSRTTFKHIVQPQFPKHVFNGVFQTQCSNDCFNNFSNTNQTHDSKQHKSKHIFKDNLQITNSKQLFNNCCQTHLSKQYSNRMSTICFQTKASTPTHEYIQNMFQTCFKYN